MMCRPNVTFFLLGCALFFHCLGREAFAVTPMWGYMSLVAGEGDGGFRDGEFHSALFDHPVALATNPEGTRIFVADRENHRIRAIDLENSNRVTTLAGSGQEGHSDGDLANATFDLPSLLAFVPENRLAVYDAGSDRLRLIDLTNGKVTTLLSLSSKKTPDPSDLVYGLAYLSGDQSLYFSQPGLRKLTRLNLSTMETKSFQADPRVPQPAALAVQGGKLCVADLQFPSVYRFEEISSAPDGNLSASMTELGKGETIVSLAGSEDKLYALQNGADPWIEVWPHPGPVKMISQWGDPLESGGMALKYLFNFQYGVGILADPSQAGNFFLALPTANSVISLKDYGFDAYKDSESVNENGLVDFSYPTAKPPHTFRILELGDSRLFFESEGEWKKRWPWGFNRMETSPKKLELFLNTWAALYGEGTHYEILHSGEKRATPVHLRPYYVAPPLIQKFDVDLALVFVPVDFEIKFYLEHPFGKEGLPLLQMDPEFLLKPLSERLHEDRDGALSDFYQRCLDRHLIKPGEEVLKDLPVLVEDAKTREDLLDMASKPLKLLAAQIKGMKTKDGHPVGFGVVFFPVDNTGGDFVLPSELYRAFWRDASREAGVPFYDMTEAVVSTRISYYPTEEMWGYHHFDHNGNSYFALLVAQMLMKEKLIPLEAGTIPPKNK